MQTAFSTDGARSPCRRPRATGSHLPAVLPSARPARPPGRPPAARRPISAPRRAAASGSQAQAAQRSGTVGLAGAWVKSPPPRSPSTWEAQGEPSRPPNRLQPPPPSRPSRAGCPSPAIGSVRALRASLQPTGCRQGYASSSWACSTRGALCCAIGECSFSTVGSSCPSTADSPLEGPPARAL